MHDDNIYVCMNSLNIVYYVGLEFGINNHMRIIINFIKIYAYFNLH